MRICTSIAIFVFAATGCATPPEPPALPSAHATDGLRSTAPFQSSYTNPANTSCPLMPDAGVDGVTTAAFNGRVIGFCCSDCLGDWQRMSDAQREAKLKAADRSAQGAK